MQRAADKAALARKGLVTAVRAAHAEGRSLRTIAEAAGVSHEQIRRMVR